MSTNSLEAARNKLAGNSDTGDPPPFPFEDLPAVRDDTLWAEIRTTYGLALAELSALKNARCVQQQIGQGTTIGSMNQQDFFRQMREALIGSPLVLTTGTQSPVEGGVVDNPHLPANFTANTSHIQVTDYPACELSARQTDKFAQKKYFNEIKRGIQDQYGTNRYVVQKSLHRMFIKDGQREIYSCYLNDHSIRCAYLELFSVDYSIDNFLRIAGQWNENVSIITTTDNM